MKRIVALVLTIILLSAFWIPANASITYSEPPDGFFGMTGVNLEVDQGYAWHIISDEEREDYELTDHTGTIYVAGNSGTNQGCISNLAIVVDEPGVLSFEYALWGLEDVTSNTFDYLGYSIDAPIEMWTDQWSCELVAQGKQVPIDGVWEQKQISVDESLIEAKGTVTIYIAYSHSEYYSTDTHLNYAAIRNVTYSTGTRSDVVKFENGGESMGTVTAELVTVTTDDKGKVTSTTYTAADINALEIGSTYRIKAVANEGYQFYGWIRNYKYDDKYYQAFEPFEADGVMVAVNDTTYYTPVFAEEGSYYIRKNTNFYTTDTPIDTVLSNASGTVVLLDDYTIPSEITSLTVPAGVTFYVPFRSIWGTAEYGNPSEGTPAVYHHNISGTLSISGMDKAYATLTIPENTTITFNGNLILGAERNASDNYGFQGHISGSFGHIQNNGTIVLGSGSTLTCYGLITGGGTVLAKDNSTVKESLIVSDFSGGNNSLQLYNQNQMPFLRYAAQNVQCTLQMEAKAELHAMAVLYAMSGHNEVDVKLFGSTNDVVFKTKVETANTVTLERTYDGSKQITSGSGNNTAGIGVTNWHVSGGLELRTLTISLSGVISLDTSKAVFPLPYNMHLELSDGTYTIDKGIAVLPGSKVTVHKDATLDLTGKLYVLDGLVNSVMSGDKYPTRADLTTAGFKGYGEFILNGTLHVRSGATLGGVIQSTQAGAVLNVEDGAYLDNRTNDLTKLDATANKLIYQSMDKFDSWAVVEDNEGIVISVKNWVVQFGGYGHYDDNTAWMDIPARIWNGTTLTQLTPGMYMSSASQSATVSDTYQGVYVPEIATGTEKGGLTYNTSDGNRYMVDGTETFDRTVSGTWKVPSDELEINRNKGAGHDKAGSLTNGVEITTAYVTNEDETLTLTITPTKGGEQVTTKFVYLITCVMSDGTTQTVSAKSDGVAILPAGTVSVTIDWAVLGDATGDGKIDGKDITMIRRDIAMDGYYLTGLQRLAADMKEDGILDGKDVTMIRRDIASNT